MTVFTEKDRLRLITYLDQSGGDDACHPFMGLRTGRGYGRFWAQSRAWRAHQVAFLINGGQLKSGEVVRHTCDNPPCCNARHLLAGTPQENVSDMVERGRSARGDRNASRTHPERVPRGDAHWTRRRPELIPQGLRRGVYTHPERVPRGDRHPSRLRPELFPRGERHGQARLTEASVRSLRERYASGGTSLGQLAAEFGVGVVTVHNAIHRKTWAHVQ